MRLVPSSLSLRITVFFSLCSVTAVAVSLVLLYATLERQISATLDEELAGRAQDVVAALRRGDESVLTRDPMAELYDDSGTPIAASPVLQRQHLLTPDQARGAVQRGHRDLSVTLGPEARRTPVRVVTEVLPDRRIVAVAASAAPLDRARDRLEVVLGAAAPALVLALSAAGWLLVRSALRPVGVLTREAAAISSMQTSRQFPGVEGDDEIARLAQTLSAMLGRLRVASERERAFVDDASHELRSPLAILRGEIELALMSDDPGEVRRGLQAALRETQRLSRLAEDLLLLARADAHTLIVRPERLDLTDLISVEAERLARLCGVAVDVRGDDVVTEADPERVRQVLSNVMDNSAAAGATSLRVTVTAAAGDAFVTIEMADDGPGLPETVQDRALERFVRGGDARTRSAIGGAGLGLSIVRAVVAAHEGTVEVRNGPPLGGAVVTVRLPGTQAASIR